MRTIVLVLMLACGLAGTVCAQPSADDRDSDPSVANPKYVELVSLREAADGTHPLPIKDRDGKIWYREKTAGANIEYLRLADTSVDLIPSDEPKSFMVKVWVKEQYKNRLRAWCDERMEMPVGVVIDGKLHAVHTLYYNLGDQFAIAPFSSLDEALQVCAGIRVGGDSTRIEAEAKRLKTEYERAMAELELLREQRAKESPPPDALEIVSLSDTRDERHTQPIDGPDGKQWYREPKAGWDLGYCETYSLGATEDAPSGFRAVLKDEHVEEFVTWCRERVGRQFGVVRDGRLVVVDKMPSELIDELNRLTLVLEPEEPLPSSTVTGDDKPHIQITVEEQFPKVRILNADYVQLVSLQPVRDDLHSTAIQASDGELWYREKSAGLNLLHCDIDDTQVVSSLDGHYHVCVRVKESYREAARTWRQKHDDGTMGVILNGRLIRVAKVPPVLRGFIQIAEYPTWEDAAEVRDCIRRGGIP